MTTSHIVHIVDDDEAMRGSLAFLLASAALETRTYESAAALLESIPADGCVVSDVRMPGMSGVELLKQLQIAASRLPVIIVTGHGDVPLAVEAMKAGAFDFIEKPFDDEILLSSVRAALAHCTHADDNDVQRAEIAGRLAGLTRREREVFDGLVAGHPNKTIAYDLGISPRTVEVYRANVMTKLQASSLSDVVRMAFVAQGRSVGSHRGDG